MAKVTLEHIECDVCHTRGERYTISFPEGMKILDRCNSHAKKIIAFKNEPGEWTDLPTGARGRAGLKISTAEDIARQRSTEST